MHQKQLPKGKKVDFHSHAILEDAAKDFYLITLGGVPDKKLMANILSDFNMYVACFSEFNPHANMRNAGAIIGTSALAPGAIRASAAMQEAYEAGKNL